MHSELEKETTPQSKWAKFFKISSLFTTEQIIDHSHEQKKKKLVSEVDKLIDANMYEIVFNMVADGYEMPARQYQNIKNIVDKEFHNLHQLNRFVTPEQINKIEIWLKTGWKLTPEQAITLLFEQSFHEHFSSSIFAKQKIKTYPLIGLQISSMIDDPSFQERYFSEWKNLVSKTNDNDSIIFPSIISILEDNHEYLLKSVKNMDDFLSLCSLYSKKLQTIGSYYISPTFHRSGLRKQFIDYKLPEKIKFMNNLLNIYFSDGIKKIIDDNLQVFSHNKIEELTTRMIQKNEAHLNQLPEGIQNILNHIKNDHQELLKNVEHLTENDKYEINNLVENRMPEILNKYFSIHEDYRLSLKNSEGKNSVDLMTDSLLNIQSYFQTMVESINQVKLNSLSASAKYTQNFKRTL